MQNIQQVIKCLFIVVVVGVGIIIVEYICSMFILFMTLYRVKQDDMALSKYQHTFLDDYLNKILQIEQYMSI